MKTSLRIGCSSYYNSYWKGIFYPDDLPRKNWFDFYCQHFDTYEINGTFYNFPRLKTFVDWFDKTPYDFLFSVKAPKLITHINKFINCQELLADFYSRAAEGLQHKLACVLFQFPPTYDYTSEKLENIIRQLNLKFDNVLEFRHESWWIPEVWARLAKDNITFCSVSHPKLPYTVFADAPLIYVRLHGTPKMFYSEYAVKELTQLKNTIASNKAKKAFVYFNNTASTAGVMNALEMKKLI